MREFHTITRHILNAEVGDVFYTRALGGISQIKVVEIESSVSFTWTTLALKAHTTALFLLPNGGKIGFDSDLEREKDYDSRLRLFMTYEGCRRNENAIMMFASELNSTYGGFLRKIADIYGLDILDYHQFAFYIITKGGVERVCSPYFVYNHDSEPFRFFVKIGDNEYVGTIDELMENNIYPNREKALDAYRPKEICFAETPTESKKKIRITYTEEMEATAEELHTLMAEVRQKGGCVTML